MGKRVAEEEAPEVPVKKKKKEKKVVEEEPVEEAVEEVVPVKKKKKDKKAAIEEVVDEEAVEEEVPVKKKKKEKKVVEEVPVEEAMEEEVPVKKKKKDKKAAIEEVVDEEEVPVKKKKKEKKAAVEEVADEEAVEEEMPVKKKKNKKAAAEEEAVEEEMPAKKKKKKAAAEEEEEEAAEEMPKVANGKIEKTDADGSKGGANDLQVFVGGLPFSADEAMLKKDFGECGTITSFKMLLKDDGSSKGCCFITYEDAEGVDKALKFDGTDYGGRWLKVNKAGDKPDGKGKGKDGKGKDGKGKGKDGKGKGKDGGGSRGNNELTVFVGGLSWSVEEDVLKKDFTECGEIVNIRMPKNDEGQSRGIAFIEFTTQEGLDAALKFDGDEYAGRTLKVNKAGEKPSGDDKGKGKGKDGKGKGKDGKGKKGKGKGKDGDAAKARNAGSIKEFEGTAKKFEDSDDDE